MSTPLDVTFNFVDGRIVEATAPAPDDDQDDQEDAPTYQVAREEVIMHWRYEMDLLVPLSSAMDYKSWKSKTLGTEAAVHERMLRSSTPSLCWSNLDTDEDESGPSLQGGPATHTTTPADATAMSAPSTPKGKSKAVAAQQAIPFSHEDEDVPVASSSRAPLRAATPGHTTSFVKFGLDTNARASTSAVSSSGLGLELGYENATEEETAGSSSTSTTRTNAASLNADAALIEEDDNDAEEEDAIAASLLFHGIVQDEDGEADVTSSNSPVQDTRSTPVVDDDNDEDYTTLTLRVRSPSRVTRLLPAEDLPVPALIVASAPNTAAPPSTTSNQILARETQERERDDLRHAQEFMRLKDATDARHLREATVVNARLQMVQRGTSLRDVPDLEPDVVMHYSPLLRAAVQVLKYVVLDGLVVALDLRREHVLAACAVVERMAPVLAKLKSKPAPRPSTGASGASRKRKHDDEEEAEDRERVARRRRFMTEETDDVPLTDVATRSSQAETAATQGSGDLVAWPTIKPMTLRFARDARCEEGAVVKPTQMINREEPAPAPMGKILRSELILNRELVQYIGTLLDEFCSP